MGYFHVHIVGVLYRIESFSLPSYSQQYSVTATVATVIEHYSRPRDFIIMSRLKDIVLLSAGLLMGIVSVQLFSDSIIHQQKLETSSYKVSGYQLAPCTSMVSDQSAPSTSKVKLVTNQSAPSTSKVQLVNDQSAPDPSTSMAIYEELVDARYLYDHLVVVTAFSDNHFEEAKDMIASMQICLPDKKIIVYDLGLSSKKKREVRKYCNVELRSFPFENYTQPHVKELNSYAWKPIIAKLVSQEYDVIMYGDASLRIISCNMSKAMEHLLKFPFLDLHPLPFRAIEFTHDGMMEYLHYPKHRKETLQATCFFNFGQIL